jgi:hypothetical protein
MEMSLFTPLNFAKAAFHTIQTLDFAAEAMTLVFSLLNFLLQLFDCSCQ